MRQPCSSPPDAAGERRPRPDGAHRAVAAAETLARVRPVLERIGVTRLADITGLDRLGIPVVLAVRPAAAVLAVDAGKGVTLPAAMASAAMEAIERWHGESATPAAIRGTYRALAGNHPVIPFERLPLARHAPFTPDWPIGWCEAADLAAGGQAVLVPHDLVWMNHIAPDPWDFGMFQHSSNGLAAGNTLLEATVSGMLELIERDGVACALEAAARGKPVPRLDPASINAPAPVALLARMAAAEVLPVMRDATSDLGVPTFIVDLYDLRSRHVGVFRGYGAHLDPVTALVRALTEAAQSRLVFISGSRDDVFRDELARNRRIDDAATLARIAAQPADRDFGVYRDLSTSSLAGDLALLTDRLQAAGLHQILRVDLTRPEMPVAVVRMLAPGLEGYRTDSYRPGMRALSGAQGGL